MSFPKSFTILVFTFRFIFWVYFWIWFEMCPNSLFWHVDIQFSLLYFLKRLLFFIELSWYPCQKSVDHKCQDLFLKSQFYSIDLYDSPYTYIPWRRKWQPTPVFLPGKSHGQRSPWGHKESDTTERFHFLYLYYCSIVLSFEVEMYESSNFIHYFQDSFGYSGSLAFQYELKHVNFC